MLIAVVGVVFAGLLLIVVQRAQKRTAAIKELALRIDFTFHGNVLSSNLDLSVRVLANTRSYSNVIEGERRGIRVIAFDGDVGNGRSWTQTFIAVGSSASIRPEWRRRLEAECSGEWTVFFPSPSYYFSCLLSASELGAYLEEL